MKTTTLLLLAFLLCVAGCEPCPESQGPIEPFKPPKREYLLAMALDTSGSFVGEMFGQDGRAYRFTLQAIERLFRDRMGADDHVLLAQLSANQRPLLWEGSPRSLKRRFGTSAALKDFILQRSDPSASRLYAGLAQVLNYLHSLPGICDGETKVCILVLSDMMDNSPTQAEDKERMIAALKRFKNLNGIGFYFVDVDCLESTRQCLTDAGLDPRFIESRIVEDPPLPSFAE